MNRTLYFIRDSLTKQYYIDKRNELGDFANAVIFHQQKNAEKGVRDRLNKWEFDLGLANTKKSDSSYEHCMERSKEAKLRKKLINWGMEVVSVNIQEPS